MTTSKILITIDKVNRLDIFRSDFDYHFVRASMVFIFLAFGYQKWFAYEAQTLVPFFQHGPLIFWMPLAFGDQGASWFLGVAEWGFGALMFAGYWNKLLGILGDLGAFFSFVCTVTIIPWMPDGWNASAGGFPAMQGNVAFLMKDFVLLAVSFYLLKQDLARLAPAAAARDDSHTVAPARRVTV